MTGRRPRWQQQTLLLNSPLDNSLWKGHLLWPGHWDTCFHIPMFIFGSEFGVKPFGLPSVYKKINIFKKVETFISMCNVHFALEVLGIPHIDHWHSFASFSHRGNFYHVPGLSLRYSGSLRGQLGWPYHWPVGQYLFFGGTCLGIHWPHCWLSPCLWHWSHCKTITRYVD